MIGENIKNLRSNANMTQKDLADMLYVTSQAVSRWENNEVEPSVSTLSQIAEIFGVTVDVIIGRKIEKEEPEVVTETKYVYQEPVKTVIGVCSKCNKPLYDSKEIGKNLSGAQTGSLLVCTSCVAKSIVNERVTKTNRTKKRRKTSYWLGGTLSLAYIGISIYASISSGDTSILFPNIVIGVLIFTFLSCLLLANNFIGDVTLDILNWGFVRMPGIIFTLDLDGIIWLLTVKLLFWILGIVLAIIFGALAIVIGMSLSLFVYPFALYKSYKHPELINLI